MFVNATQIILFKLIIFSFSSAQTVFLPIPGLVSGDELKPTDLVGVNKDNFLILEKLPTE